ncbi:MAG: hypothetical protein WBD39_16485, partial [Candidatus Acidiferrales bacterium]
MRNLQTHFGAIRQSLGASQSSIGRTNWASCGEHGTLAIQHHKASVLIGQPAKRGESDGAIVADHHKPPDAMPDAG